MVKSIHPAAPLHVPCFITGPDETDVLMVATAIFLLFAVLAVGNMFLRLHTLPERMAHKSQNLQFEIAAAEGQLELHEFSKPILRCVAALEQTAQMRCRC